MTTIPKLAGSGAALAAMFALFLMGCPGTGGDDPVCGNGVPEQGESCDDGNTIDGDGCSSECAYEGFCGNGQLEPGEECDDGNFQPGDGCDADCNVEDGCGNGILDAGEGCDDDNLASGDGCSATCVDEEPGAVCGNGIWEISEGCEDGNTEDGDGCSADCQREDGCGDGVVDFPEECDDGNNVSGDGCLYDCRNEFVANDGNCDEDNNETCEYSPADCCPDCGNFVLDAGEGCDDGNNVSGDGCSQGCTDEDQGSVCGNHIIEPGETCDDNNTDPGDGCDASCQAEYVTGDGTCDTANGENCVNSQADCCPDCGNGTLGPGEQCDGIDFGGITCEDFCYEGGTPTCTAACQIDTSSCTGALPTCGDDSAGCDEECDTDDLRGQTCETLGFESGTLTCGSSCTFDTSACQDRLWYLSADFEDGLPANWLTHGMWEVGTPASVGPAAAHAGADCAGTVIGGNYVDDGTFAFDWLETPRVDLTNATVPVMLFYVWLDAESQADGGNLRISTDGGQSFLPIPTGNVQPAYNHDDVAGESAWTGGFANSGWKPMMVNLLPWAGQEVVLRFGFSSDAVNNDAGWYVDDVLIAEAPEIPVQLISVDPLNSAVSGYVYDNQIEVLGGSGNYDWTLTGGTNIDWLTIGASTGVLTGTPDASDVGPVTVTIRVEDTANASNFDEQTYYLVVLNALYFEDLETNPADWTFPMGVPGLMEPVWDWGNATSGPMSCYGGSGCVGTTVAGNYDASMAMMGAAVVTGDIDLTGATAPVVLTYYQWINFAPNDGGSVLVNGAALANPSVPYNGQYTPVFPPGPPVDIWTGDMSAMGWHLVSFDLSSYIGQTIQISWNVSGAAVGTHPGWYIDDILIAN